MRRYITLCWWHARLWLHLRQRRTIADLEATGWGRAKLRWFFQIFWLKTPLWLLVPVVSRTARWFVFGECSPYEGLHLILNTIDTRPK